MPYSCYYVDVGLLVCYIIVVTLFFLSGWLRLSVLYCLGEWFAAIFSRPLTTMDVLWFC